MQFYTLEDLGLTKETRPTRSEAHPFTSIGIGKPLTIRLLTIHVGDLQTGILSNKQSIIVTSMIKDDITYNVPSRGVHQIFKSAKDRDTMWPRAQNEGTELIYYTNALDSGRLKIDIDIKADKFRKNVFDSLSKGFSTSAMLPIFAPYASTLLAGGQVLNIAGKAFNRALEKDPILSFPFDISRDIAGFKNSKSGYRFGINNNDEGEFIGYEVSLNSSDKPILSKNGQPYRGDCPYIIISVDGKRQAHYADFKATLASAAIMTKFYGISESGSLDSDIMSMLKLYNDYNYVKKVKDAKKEMGRTSDTEKKAELTNLIKAYKMNIKNDDFLTILDQESEGGPS